MDHGTQIKQLMLQVKRHYDNLGMPVSKLSLEIERKTLILTIKYTDNDTERTDLWAQSSQGSIALVLSALTNLFPNVR